MYRLFTTVVVLACVSSLPAAAQDARGTLLGRVTDTSGAVVPNASVTVVNKATGVAFSSKTNDQGNFYAPYLSPGTYSITCEVTGFKTWVLPEAQVRVNDNVEVNIQLQVGQTTETIEVTDSAPLLSTAESSLGQVIDEKRILELPLFAGNAMDLVHLAPGTVNGTNLRLRKAAFNAAPSSFSTDGAGNNTNEFSIDGVSNSFSNGTAPRVAFSPPRSAIGEFKVQTSAFDASLGRTMGSTVNVSTKGGTNEFHGEIHYWLRHSALDAPTVFQNRSGQTPPVYQDHLYGGSIGGPVSIPKVYEGKNKTFFFFSYEANKFGNPAAGGAGTSTVPTPKMRQGDLSEYLALGKAYQVYDPFSTVANSNGTFSRSPVPGNIIPKSLINPVAMNIINYYPLPNQPGTSDFRNNFFLGGKALEDYWVWVARVDHTFTQNNRMFVRLHRDYWEEDKNRWFGNDYPNGIVLNRNNKGIAFDDVHVFNPTFLLNFRYGLTYQDFPERRVSQGFDLSALGFSQNFLNLIPDPELATFPRMTIAPWSTLSSWESGDGVTSSLSHNFVGTFTKIQGDHNIRFGTEFRVFREFRNRYQTAISPDFSFSSSFTNGPLNTNAAPTAGVGNIASMFFGIPAGSMTRAASFAEQDKYFSLYIHDDWKVSRKLTVNIGLRYELETPLTERFDRAAIHYDETTPNPLNDAARANYAKSPIPELAPADFSAMGGLTFANVGGNPREYWSGQQSVFMPRIGFAYQLLPKTVLRGGYGIFYNSIGVMYTDTNQTGFSQSTPMQASLDNGLTFPATLDNPFPNGLLTPPGASQGLLTNIGQGVSFFLGERKQPYSQRWTFGFQHLLPQDILVDVAYVGNRATRLQVNRSLNNTPAEYLSTSPVRDQTTINYLGQNFPNPFFGLDPIYGKNMNRGNLLRPFPHFSGVTITGDPAGYTWYHSLQTRLERRFKNGFTMQGSYTWSKNMEATGFLNAQDPMPEEVISGIHRTHRLVASGIFEIPVGRGRKFANDLNRGLDYVVGGWQISGMYQHQSGQPLGFGNRIFNGDLHQIVLPKDERNVDAWFYPAAQAGFETSGARQLSQNLRRFNTRFNAVQGPNQDRWDISLIKYFQITEWWKTELRVESFNAMNHPNLYNPNTDPTSGSWGRITGQDSPRTFQVAIKMTF